MNSNDKSNTGDVLLDCYAEDESCDSDNMLVTCDDVESPPEQRIPTICKVIAHKLMKFTKCEQCRESLVEISDRLDSSDGVR
jgi:hypothetical protein